MLVFAEAYDPLWEARVYEDGKLVERLKSRVLLYGYFGMGNVGDEAILSVLIKELKAVSRTEI